MSLSIVGQIFEDSLPGARKGRQKGLLLIYCKWYDLPGVKVLGKGSIGTFLMSGNATGDDCKDQV